MKVLCQEVWWGQLERAEQLQSKSALAQTGSAVNNVVITDRLKAILKDKLDLTSN